MAQIQLDYLLTSPYALAPADMQAKVQAIQLSRGELDLLGMTEVSSTTTIEPDGRTLRKSVVLQTTALGDSSFPNIAAKKDATRKLYAGSLSLGVGAVFDSLEPVVT